MTSIAKVISEVEGVYLIKEGDGIIEIETDKGSVGSILRIMRELGEYKQLIDIVGSEGEEGEIRVRYIIQNIREVCRGVIKVDLGNRLSIESIKDIYSGSDWAERELYDMYGVEVGERRRILTDYGYEGYLMRKEEGLTGVEERRYSERKKGVVVGR